MSSLVEDVRERLRAERFEMPNLPHVATQALALAQSEDSTARQLSDLICQDQALATNLLRMANSPAFAGARSIVSLQQAITRLGMGTVADLAVTICVKGSLFPKGAAAGRSQALWSHSLGSALFAREIARLCRRNVEAAYLCGLLHRIGMPIVLKAIVDIGGDYDDAEIDAALAELHVETGLQASEFWMLPGQVSVAIRHYQNFSESTQHSSLAAVVHLASFMAERVAREEDLDATRELPVLDELSLYPDQMQRIIDMQEDVASAMKAG